MRVIGFYDWHDDRETEQLRHYHVYIHNGKHYTGHCPTNDNAARRSVMSWLEMFELAYDNKNEWDAPGEDPDLEYLFPLEYLMGG